MKSGEEMRQFLENLMGWGFDRPWMYGGSPSATDTVFWHWRMIWAELMDRQGDFFTAISRGEDPDIPEPSVHHYSQEFSTDPNAYKDIVDFWRRVDDRLGIEHPRVG